MPSPRPYRASALFCAIGLHFDTPWTSRPTQVFIYQARLPQGARTTRGEAPTQDPAPARERHRHTITIAVYPHTPGPLSCLRVFVDTYLVSERTAPQLPLYTSIRGKGTHDIYSARGGVKALSKSRARVKAQVPRHSPLLPGFHAPGDYGRRARSPSERGASGRYRQHHREREGKIIHSSHQRPGAYIHRKTMSSVSESCQGTKDNARVSERSGNVKLD